MKSADAAPSTPDTTAPSTEYSDWSKEEETAYQEFKGMWKIATKDKGDRKYHIDGSYDETPWESYTLTCIKNLETEEFYKVLETAKESGYITRLAHEIRTTNLIVEMYFLNGDGLVSGIIVK